MEIQPITEEMVWKRLLPRRADSHKGTYGTLTILAGSALYRGAAALAALAALRCGAGIVCLASTEKVIASASAKLYECIFRPLPENPRGSIDFENGFELLKPCLAHSAAILAGCGMTDCPDTVNYMRLLLADAECPLILDADALNSLKRSPELLKTAKNPPILTPHVGEAARLTGLSIAQIKENAPGTAVGMAQRYSSIVVLKDAVTYVASPDGVVCRNTTGNAGLAKGGSGDVLSGMIASFAAQGLSSADAAVCGVWLHGRAADRLVGTRSQYGLLPSELPDALCEIFTENGR